MKLYLILFLCVFCSIQCFSQETDSPNIAYVYPAGAQKGVKTKLVVGGRGFKDAYAIIVTGNGAKATVSNITIPAQRNDKNSLFYKFEKIYIEKNPEVRPVIEKLSAKEAQRFLRKEIVKDPEKLAQLNALDESFHLRLVSSDALAETIEFELDIASDAKVGERRLFVITPYGVSNPVTFMVGNLPEFSKPSLREVARERAKNAKNKGSLIWGYMKKSFLVPKIDPPMEVKIPTVVNGQITEAKVDRFIFSAKKGQRVVAALAARALIPYISDAVPGWFQPVLKIMDSNGKELAYNDDFFHRPDPYICFDIPQDGKYIIEIHDAIFRSREDFVYRLTLGELPFAHSFFPHVVRKGKVSNLRLLGDNLKHDSIKVLNKKDFLFESESIYNNRLPIAVSSQNSTISQAEIIFSTGGDLKKIAPQKISLPMCVDGIIRREGQRDVYRISLAKDEEVLVETFARRLDSPLDSYLTISDANGKILAFSDDYEDSSRAYVTHHADSRILFKAPQAGNYYVAVSDTAEKYSPYHSYRLCIGAPIPDFELISERSCVNIPAGGTDSFSVKIHRKNGFNGDVKIYAKGLPKGWKIAGGEIPSGANSAEITISASKEAKGELYYLEFYGECKKYGITKKMIPADNMMQAFYYWHQVPSQVFRAHVKKDSLVAGQFKSLKLEYKNPDAPLKIANDKPFNLRIGSIRPKSKLWAIVPDVDSISAEAGFKALSVFEYKKGFYVKLDATKMKAGTKGNLVISIYVKRKGKRFIFGKLPSIKYEVIEPKKGK